MHITRIGSGTGPGSKFMTEAIVDALRGSLRASLGPLDHTDMLGNSFGFFRANLFSGTTVSLSANSPIASMRWTATNSVAVLLRVTASPAIPSAVTAATIVDVELIRATGFSAADTTGTQVAGSSAAAALRPVRNASMSASGVGDLRVATTAGLTAGVRTLDGAGFAVANFPILIATNSSNVGVALAVGAGAATQTVYEWNVSQEHPIVLQATEGIIARNVTAGPTTGGVRYALTFSWAELAGF